MFHDYCQRDELTGWQKISSEIPAGAKWTKVTRSQVNPQALEEAGERFEERDGYVIILRVVPRAEIDKLAEKTRQIRGEFSNTNGSTKH